MKIIVGKNSTGKTRDLIQYSLETGIPILAYTGRKADSLLEKSVAYFEKPVKVITLHDLSTDYNGDILVDDIEKLCDFMLKDYCMNNRFNIAGVTITED
jgi:hypothetical protein